jgi:pantetheine-phosphate adenylyltransferase
LQNDGVKTIVIAKGREVYVKIAVYPGSFDPITNGHLDIVRRAGQMFDRVIVAVAIDTEKKPLFGVDERRRLVAAAVKGLRNVSVDAFEGLLIQYARRKRATAVVRGLRAVSDFEFEFQLALMNRKLDPGIETIFLMTKDEYTFISSRLVKEIGELGGDVSDFVPRGVERAMKRKFGSR